MIKAAFISAVIVMITCSIIHAAIITVDNKTPSVGDYTTLQAAHDAASDGDTIYVYPSWAVYNGITVTKTLTFVGTGFGYPSEGMNTTLLTGTMTFSAGSDGSSLEGFRRSDSFYVTYFYVTIDADNITIKRNRLYKITVSKNHTGTVILQNYLHDESDAWLIEVGNYNELLIANNKLINKSYNGKGIYAPHPNITITVLHNVIRVYNNVNALHLDNSNKFVANNIIVSGQCTGTSGYYYNMCNGSQLPNRDGNIINVNMITVFDTPNPSDPYHFHLLPDSPAIGAGQNGVDMGMYSGSTSFVDGGAPSLPSIFHLESDHVGSQQTGLDVTIKAKSNMQ